MSFLCGMREGLEDAVNVFVAVILTLSYDLGDIRRYPSRYLLCQRWRSDFAGSKTSLLAYKDKEPRIGYVR